MQRSSNVVTSTESDVTAPSEGVVLLLLVYRAGHVFMLLHVSLLFLPACGTVGPLPLPTHSGGGTPLDANTNIAC